MKTSRTAFLVSLLVVSFTPVCVRAQGFGTVSKKKIDLHRKLPAAIHLPGNALKIQVASRSPESAEMANKISDILQAQLQKYDTNLRMDPDHPDAIVTCTITSYSMPPAQMITRNIPTTKKVGKSYVEVQEPHRFYDVKGSLDLTYQAKDAHSGKTLDSDIVNEKYAQEFAVDSDTSASSQSTLSQSVSIFKKGMQKVSKKNEEAAPTVPTSTELQDLLAHHASDRIAARLVNTNETVEVLLARGKLDDANKMADAGLWTRMLETLEQMTPFPNKEDDAYRLYNIGVAYEALGYQADDAVSAKRFFDQAAISYGKAIDDKPSEKYFLEPQNRIETSLAHYRKLEQQPVEAHKKSDAATTKEAADKETETSDAEAKPTGAKSRGIAGRKGGVTNASEKEKLSTSGDSETKIAQASSGALNNDQIIKLYKAGMDEDNLIATISEARTTNFDVSVDGQMQLVTAGIKGKLLTAIRRKAASQKIQK